jgi:hypothetical protein
MTAGLRLDFNVVFNYIEERYTNNQSATVHCLQVTRLQVARWKVDESKLTS